MFENLKNGMKVFWFEMVKWAALIWFMSWLNAPMLNLIILIILIPVILSRIVQIARLMKFLREFRLAERHFYGVADEIEVWRSGFDSLKKRECLLTGTVDRLIEEVNGPRVKGEINTITSSCSDFISEIVAFVHHDLPCFRNRGESLMAELNHAKKTLDIIYESRPEISIFDVNALLDKTGLVLSFALPKSVRERVFTPCLCEIEEDFALAPKEGIVGGLVKVGFFIRIIVAFVQSVWQWLAKGLLSMIGFLYLTLMR